MEKFKVSEVEKFDITESEREEIDFWMVTMVSEHGIVVTNTVTGKPFRELVTKKWERVEALIESWDGIPAGYEIIVNEMVISSSQTFTKLQTSEFEFGS